MINEYLAYEVTQQPDAIEKLFCEPFAKLALRTLTQDEVQTFVSLYFADQEARQNPNDSRIQEMDRQLTEKMQAYGIMTKRLKACYDFTLSIPAKAFLASIIDRPGVVVMYLTYLQYRAKKANTRELTMEELGIDIFPLGVPTEDALRQLWISVKVNRKEGQFGSDNLLDYGSAMKSILFTPENDTNGTDKAGV